MSVATERMIVFHRKQHVLTIMDPLHAHVKLATLEMDVNALVSYLIFSFIHPFIHLFFNQLVN